MTIWQCAYTNVSETENGNLVTGWKPVCTSEDIPKEALDEAVKYHGINSKITGSMTDEDGNVLNLYEINSTDSYVFVSKSLYGLRDHAGRANMFGHMFILPWDDKVISDPNRFLNIASTNYKATVDAASEIGQNLDSLDKDKTWDINEAMSYLNMDKGKHIVLTQCVFAQYADSRSAKPLYIQYDGDELKLKAIIYLIYAGLPYFFRKRIKIASDVGNSVSQTNIVFCKNINDKNWYLNPETGENNILNERTLNRIEKLGMIDYALKSYDTYAEMDEYFKKLDQRSMDFAGGGKPDIATISMAHSSLVSSSFEEIDDEELKDRIGDILRLNGNGSEELDLYISKHIEEAYRRDIALFPKTEERLHERFQQDATDALKESIKRYFIQRITALDIKEASKILFGLSVDEFKEYKDILLKSDKGNEILEDYYCSKLLSQTNVDWRLLSDFNKDTRELLMREELLKVMNDKAHLIYADSLKKKVNEYENYLSYREFLTEVYEENESLRYTEKASEEYWASRTLKDYSYEDADIYKEMKAEHTMYKSYILITFLLHTLQAQGPETMLRNVYKYAPKIKELVSLSQKEDFYSLLENNSKAILSASPSLMPSDAFIGNQIRMASGQISASQINAMQDIREAYDQKQLDDIIKNYEKFISDAETDRADEISEMNKMALAMLKRLEQKMGFVVPADYWIRFGESMYRNPFSIFDYTLPNIFREEKDELQSELLKRDYYKNKAKEYIKSKGEASKDIKMLLKAVKKKEKEDLDIEDFDDLDEGPRGIRKGLLGGLFRKRNDD